MKAWRVERLRESGEGVSGFAPDNRVLGRFVRPRD